MSLFIRLFDESTQKEVNVNADHIATFLPAEDSTGSTIRLLNGMIHQVKQSNRSIRHAIKKSYEVLSD